METYDTRIIAIFAALFLCFICYYPALYAPFYIDDFGSIVNNTKLFTLSISELFRVYGMRFVGYLSFAINGLIVENLDANSFRIFNFFIHLAVSLLIFFLTNLLIKLSADLTGFRNSKIRYLPVLLCLLYLVHPLNTQAVTYVIQRLASLVALFYIASLYFYLLARTSFSTRSTLIYYIASFSLFLLAIFTKQNAVTLPLIIILCEFIFFKKQKVVNVKKYNKFIILLVFVLALMGVYFKEHLFHLFTLLDTYTRETQLISRSEYASTQVLMLWDYVYKFFAPISLQLNYPNILLGSFADAKVIFALLGHLALIMLSVKLNKTSPMFTFGILFYYIAHLVESSFIPITDLGFEHRTYLPNIGLVIALAGFIISIVERFSISAIKYAYGLLLLIIIFFSVLTFNRNTLWADKLAFAKNEVLVAPQSVRANSMLAAQYLNEDKRVKALEYYQKAINLSVASNVVGYDLLRDYIKVLYSLGQYESAGPLTTLVIKYTNAHKRKDRSEVLALIAVSHREAGRLGFAKGLLIQATKLDVDNSFAHHQLATILWNMGDREQATKVLKQFKLRHPDDIQINSLLEQMLAILH